MKPSAVSVGKAICLALACALAIGIADATVNSDGSFRLLRLNGYHVKWGDSALGAGATVSYALVDAPMRFEGARNCRDLVPINDLATRHGISQATLHAETASTSSARH